jgi:hypothetical protein
MGLVMGETDFSRLSYRHAGALPGIDIAYLADGAAYHTTVDTMERLRAGVLQVGRAGGGAGGRAGRRVEGRWRGRGCAESPWQTPFNPGPTPVVRALPGPLQPPPRPRFKNPARPLSEPLVDSQPLS